MIGIMITRGDKRKFKRVDYTIQAVLEMDGSSQVYLQTRDINMHGIFLETDKPLAIGTTGKLNIHLQCGSQSEYIHASFKVVRHQKAKADQPAGMGVEFTDIDSDSSITLFNMVKFHGGFENI